MSLNLIPQKLHDLLPPKQHSIVTITFSAQGQVVRQRRFKDGGEDPLTWCEEHWRDDYTWKVAVTPYSPATVTYVDGSRERSK